MGTAQKDEFAMISRLPFICLLFAAGACAAVEPLGDGHIRNPCRRLANGTLVAVHDCVDETQETICNISVDAGADGLIPGVCCDVGQSREACARVGGFTDAGSPRADASNQ